MNVLELSKILNYPLDKLVDILTGYGYLISDVEKCQIDKGMVRCLENFADYKPERDRIDSIIWNLRLVHLDVPLFEEDDKYGEGLFRLLSISVCVDGKYESEIKISAPFRQLEDGSKDQFSLFIGVNGVGKSSLFRELIDFFVDLNEYKNTGIDFSAKRLRRKPKHILVNGVSFLWGNQLYDVRRNLNEEKFLVNGLDTRPNILPVPNLVASCFGISDKFPIKNTLSASAKKNKYDVPFYTYVGARASSNIFSSANTLFQMLDTVLKLRKVETILKLRDVFQFVGYEPRLQLKLKLKVIASNVSFDSFTRYVEDLNDTKSSARRHWYITKFLALTTKEKQSLYKTYKEACLKVDLKNKYYNYSFSLDGSCISKNKDEFKNLYQLRQLGLISSVDCLLYRNSMQIGCNDLSSGEFAMLCTIAGVLSASEFGHTLVLIDEPEISQHPNWQMQMIDLLNMTLRDCKCHFLIATHSHFLVSDLPKYKSSVSYLYRNDEGKFTSERIKEDTYGWSADEVLLKVFKLSTTRNIYLADMVGYLLDGIAQGNLRSDDIKDKINFLSQVLCNMNDVDPMKKIISTIVKTYRDEK